MRRRAVRVVLGLLVCALVVLGLFVANGLWPSWQTPYFGTTDTPPSSAKISHVRVLAYNIAKCQAYDGSGFSKTSVIESCLDGVAALIRKERADIVFLSEIVRECGPCPVDQVAYLARAAGMHAFAYGENFSWGLPFFRISAGNAMLSRFPLTPLEVQQLKSDSPFYAPTNNRRLVWANVEINSKAWLTAALRNDSFSLARNHEHAKEILDKLDGRTALLGGDFNAEIHDAAMKSFEKSGLFTGEWRGPKTFPSHRPTRCIDFVLAPNTWKLVGHRVIATDLSDHLPVLSTFALPG